ncbi:aryl-sulfate sulfotransferase [Gordonibacter massiliensis (ex Traore et al. 2017)]|uniref:Aryl-sulfate sulfotransferase n=1 Tax=Gordonibacter massiliensis (ex Traore et al. 2017) TaxID=1841863 RepID=A0A842JGR0_9ACTN|nr:aryl-sulfate sulfotransferase [Gordonibacter massiliensis (ex Traore et al. 2017)]MBC2890206.1 aryl-sulfate sulfotransferase [Gordonibacter massiliensis (ex Traore et al. 2017)]
MGRPTVFPTGTTIYDPEKCQSGYTLFTGPNKGVLLINMNGKAVRYWKDFQGFPCKMIPGGHLFGHLGERDPEAAYQDQTDLTEVDWDGNVEWTFNRNQEVDDGDGGKQWVARTHHDYQIEGNPVGYHVPGQESTDDFNKVLLLTHNDVRKPKISPQLLLDDRLIEIDREGNIQWEWSTLDHLNDFNFTEAQKNVIYRDPNTQDAGAEGEGDLFHVNCASYLGPNHWYDEGDERFNPNNIIMDSREANMLWILDHETGDIVWKIGPDYTASRELRILGAIIGPHHTHMIPRGLPGEGNILVYDNGGWAGYDQPSQVSKTGLKTQRRDGSRVIELDPVTLKVVWECRDTNETVGFPFSAHNFYSPLTSDAQRLENGNTLICEGTTGRIMEMTPEKELVWEYVYPDVGPALLYRAYRIPYEWIPQLDAPEEVAIPRCDNAQFRLPGAEATGYDEAEVSVEGTTGFHANSAHCVDKLN